MNSFIHTHTHTHTHLYICYYTHTHTHTYTHIQKVCGGRAAREAHEGERDRHQVGGVGRAKDDPAGETAFGRILIRGGGIVVAVICDYMRYWFYCGAVYK